MQIDYELIVFSDEWHGLPFSCKHLLRHFLPDVRLIWVETIGLRSPRLNLYDISRSIRKLSEWIMSPRSYPKSYPENLHILNPLQIPYNYVGIIRNLNKLIMIRSLQQLSRNRADVARVLITTWPFVGNLLGHLGEDLSVYYRVDDYSEFPGVHRHNIKRLEYELIKKVDMVVATAEALTGVQTAQKPVHYLPHGVDFEHFSREEDDSGDDLPIHQIPAPRIGFFGLLSSWIDFELLSQVAADRPRYSFVFVGPSQISVPHLPKAHNIHYLGPVPYEELPRHARHFDVGLIPFKLNTLTEQVNPLKLLEYLALGLPVVSTSLPEVHKYKDFVAIAKDPQTFCKAIDSALQHDDFRARMARKQVAKAHSWAQRSQCLKTWIQEGLARKIGFSPSSTELQS